MFEIVDRAPPNAVIKVIGVGGGGGNAVKHMIARQIEGVEFIAVNTDAQALAKVEARTTLQIGRNLTGGLGAGSDPEVGREAALEDRDSLIEVLEGADMVFIAAGMGGGTGTGGAPILAEIAGELGILTVAVVTKPFHEERRKRMDAAEKGIVELRQHVDSLIVLSNDKLRAVFGEATTVHDAFGKANDVLLGAVQGIADIIFRPGVINVDFADVRTVMSGRGLAMMGTGIACGADRGREAAERAVNSPLLDDVNLQGARGILVNITADAGFTLGEFDMVKDLVDSFASETATVIPGLVIDEELTDEVRVTVIAAGLDMPDMSAALKLVEGPAKKHTTVEGSEDYDVPTITRRRGADASEQSESSWSGAASEVDLEYLDVPTFVRRQAD